METNVNTQIIEINGIKMEVDLRHAKVVHDNLRVGSKVRILIRDYSGNQEVHPGVIVGFDMFPDLPTIIVCYIVHSYAEAKLEFAYINTSEKSQQKYSMIPAHDDDMPVRRSLVHQYLDKEIAKREAEIQELERKRAYFESTFGAYFKTAETAKSD